jgi:multicomponent Na+:H+ antiporter subunit E
MKYAVALGMTLFGVWLLWSGHYNPLLISFGAVSCLLVVLLSWRMDIVDEEAAPVQLGLRPFIFYAPWLAWRIVLANIDVARLILDPQLPVSPVIVRVKASQKGDLGRVIYANSITLTPGTVSVDMMGDVITVHALTTKLAESDQSGDMDRRVTQLEERG